MEVRVNGRLFKVEETSRNNARIQLSIDGEALELEVLTQPGTDRSTLLVRSGPRVFLSRAIREGDGKTVKAWVNDKPLNVELSTGPELATGRLSSTVANGPVSVDAPMAGRIVEVKAAVGQTAAQGESLVVLEAMKMENEIAAPRGGTVKEVHVKIGSLVKAGDRLVILD